MDVGTLFEKDNYLCKKQRWNQGVEWHNVIRHMVNRQLCWSSNYIHWERQGYL